VTALPASYPALVVEHGEDESSPELRDLTAGEAGEGDVEIAVEWSSVNYKDALAASPRGNVARISPLVPGIDLVGRVLAGTGELGEGRQVLVHGYELGVAHHGGYAAYARVPADWVLPLPDGLSGRQAMALGTAGFTAALSVQRLEDRGLSPQHGPVLVLGATGGVGSTAVGILAERGYEVVASTGSDGEAFLREIGAAEVIARSETEQAGDRPLDRQRWAAVVDPVGGASTAYALSTTRYAGAVALSGLTAGTGLETTVLPFILRSVSLIGIDSVQTPMDERRRVWERLAGDLRPRGLDEAIAREVALADVPGVLDALLAGEARGRTVVRVGEG